MSKMRESGKLHCHYCTMRVFPQADGIHGPNNGAKFPNTATVDHYYPKCLLKHKQEEETVICRIRCNDMKSNTPPEVFKKYIELFGKRGLENRRAYRVFCYRLMLAGLHYESVQKNMKDEFSWMAP